MNTLTSIAAHGLLPVPLMSNTPHSRDLGCGTAKAAPLGWLPQDATQRLELQDELAPMRRELRIAMLLRAAASLPRPSQVAEASGAKPSACRSGTFGCWPYSPR
jgi:hypothetical protein